MNQKLLSAAQEIFEQIIKVEMLQDQKDWAFDQFEFRRIVPLVEDSILLGLLDHFFDFSPPWKTIEDWRDWAEIRRAIILRLEELGLFEKLHIHLQSLSSSQNGEPILQ